MANRILYDSFQLVLFFLQMSCLHFVLEGRFPLALNLVLELLSFGLYACAAVFLPLQSFARFLAGTTAFLAATQILFRGKWAVKLFLALAELVIMAAAELASFFLLPAGYSASTVMEAPFPVLLAVYVNDFFVNFMLLAALASLARHYRLRYSGQIAGMEWLYFLLFPLSQYVLFLAWFFPPGNAFVFENKGFLFPAVAFCLAADVVMALMVRRVGRNAELRARNRLLEQQIDSQRDYYDKLASYYEDLRRMRHDIANHMYTIKILLEDGQTADAEKYAEELRQSSRSASQLVNCLNPAADIFLSRRCEELEAAGIRPELTVNIPAEIGVSNSDLICILGNLLDNAAEACAPLPDKWIELRAVYASPYLRVETRNPCTAAPPRRKRRIPELERGVGFAVLQHLAQKYDGHFSAGSEGGVYTAALILNCKPSAGHTAS